MWNVNRLYNLSVGCNPLHLRSESRVSHDEADEAAGEFSKSNV